MTCDWLAQRECLFLVESLIKIHVFKVRGEDFLYPYRRQENEKKISPSTKVSSAKAKLFEKLSNKERLHQPDTLFVCFSNKTKCFRLVGWLFYRVSIFFGPSEAELSHFYKSFKQFSKVWTVFVYTVKC